MASNTVIVRVLGNTTSLSRSLKKAQVDLAGLDRINDNIGRGFKTAAIGAAVFGAAAVGAGAAGAAALAAVPLAIAGIGIAFAAQNKKVKNAFSDLKTDVVDQMKGFAEPLVQPLVRTADALGKAFDVIAPAIKQTFAATAPLINQFNRGLIPVAKQIKPLITEAFKAGVPVLQAFGRAVTPIIQGLRGFFKALEGGNKAAPFVAFVEQLGNAFKVLLPAIGRLLAALAPIGTAILSVLVPALASMFDWISAKIGPAFAALTGAIQNHPTLFKNIAIAVISFVVAMKVAALGVALFNGIMGIAGVAVNVFKGIMLAIRGVTMAWTAAQWLLNAALMANPIGLIIAAIALLVAAFVIAYKKSETFRNIVNGAWQGIKAASVAVFNFLKGFIVGTWNAIKGAVMGAVNGVRSVVSGAWNAIRSASAAVWGAIRSVVSSAVNGVRSVVSSVFNSVRSLVSNVWNSVKSATTSAWNAVKNAVSSGVNTMMGFITSIPGKVQSALSGAGTWLLDAGRQIIQGLIDGINSMIGAVQSKLSALTNLIPDWKGPRDKDKRLLRPAGRLIIKGLIKGFEDGKAGVKKALGDITNDIEKFFKKHGLSDKRAKNLSKATERFMKQNQKTLIKYAKKVSAAYNKVGKAQEKLKDIQKASADYAKSIAGKARDYVAITALNSAFNSDAMLQQMRARIEKVRQFNAVLQDLVKKGLNKNLIDQLAQAGVEGGLSYALAIQSGGTGAIKEFNALQGELTSVSNALGDTTADSMYKAGIKAAQGLVKGLKSKAKVIAKQARGFAQLLVKAIKQQLGIHSPSRVFARLGEQTLAGMQVGLKDVRGVERAMVNVADAMKASFDRPQLTATAMGSGSGGSNTYNVTVMVNNTDSPEEMGRKFQKAIDAYQATGGRRRA